jgi:hypothetical protein
VIDSEQNVFEKVTTDFQVEVDALDACIDTIESCVLVLIHKVAIFQRPSLNISLRQASTRTRCTAVQALLLYHALANLKAARFLVLVGYPAPALSCLRTTIESTLNAHVCYISDEQALKWVKYQRVNRSGFGYPNYFKDAREMLDTLNKHGSHPDYLAVGQQGYYQGLVFSTDNKQDYEFLTLRAIHFCLLVSNRLLAYILGKRWSVKKEIANAEGTMRSVRKVTGEVGDRVLAMLSQ